MSNLVPYQVCPLCNGSGRYISTNPSTSALNSICPVCNGSRIIPMYNPTPNYRELRERADILGMGNVSEEDLVKANELLDKSGWTPGKTPEEKEAFSIVDQITKILVEQKAGKIPEKEDDLGFNLILSHVKLHTLDEAIEAFMGGCLVIPAEIKDSGKYIRTYNGIDVFIGNPLWVGHLVENGVIEDIDHMRSAYANGKYWLKLIKL